MKVQTYLLGLHAFSWITYCLAADAPNNLSTINIVRRSVEVSKMSAIIGPYSTVVSLVADSLRVPYFITSMPTSCDRNLTSPYSVHMVPTHHVIHRAVMDVVERFRWENVAVLYDTGQGLHLMGDLMTMTSVQVRAWRLRSDSSQEEVRDDLLTIRQLERKRIIVACEKHLLQLVFQQAMKLSMLSDRYFWIIVNLDPSQVDYSPYTYTNVNITAFRALSDEYIQSDIWRTSNLTKLQTAYVQDGLKMLYKSLVDFAKEDGFITCKEGEACVQIVRGQSLMPFVKKTAFKGATNQMRIGALNERTDMFFTIVALNDSGLYNIGGWDQKGLSQTERLTLRIPPSRDADAGRDLFGGEVTRVVTIREAPFVMFKKDHLNREGNDRYEGFCIDLLEAISKVANFRYEIYEPRDEKYGSRDKKTGKWNGMVNELIHGNASMCIGAISITSEREQAIDFTKPFKDRTYSILMRKPGKKNSIFQFFTPLAGEVWGMNILAYVIVSLLLILLDAVSPNNLEDPSVPRYGTRESFWFFYASLVGAGTEVTPRTISSRLLTGAWWFFTLIIISSYTANLAASLTVTKIETPINTVGDLANQQKIKYGTVHGTFAESFFQNSHMETFQKMWTFMSEVHPDSLVKNSSVGLQKVLAEDYAFIWDDPINEYTTTQQCDTMVVAEGIDRKGYGIGVPMGAAYRDRLTMAILHLNEQGRIQELETRWWEGGKCEEFKSTQTGLTNELKLENVAGVFVVLLCGILASCLICGIEYFFGKRKKKNKKQKELKEVATKEPMIPENEPKANYGSEKPPQNGHEVVLPLNDLEDWPN